MRTQTHSPSYHARLPKTYCSDDTAWPFGRLAGDLRTALG